MVSELVELSPPKKTNKFTASSGASTTPATILQRWQRFVMLYFRADVVRINFS